MTQLWTYADLKHTSPSHHHVRRHSPPTKEVLTWCDNHRPIYDRRAASALQLLLQAVRKDPSAFRTRPANRHVFLHRIGPFLSHSLAACLSLGHVLEGLRRAALQRRGGARGERLRRSDLSSSGAVFRRGIGYGEVHVNTTATLSQRWVPQVRWWSVAKRVR